MFLCEREIARKDGRRIEMASTIAHFPTFAILTESALLRELARIAAVSDTLPL